MSVRSGSYLSLALALSLTAACGAETPATDQTDVDPSEEESADESGDSDEPVTDDEEPPAADEDDDAAPSAPAVKDASSPRADAGPAKSDAGTTKSDAGPAKSDAGGSASDAGPAKGDAAAGGDSGSSSGSDAGSGGKTGTGECCQGGDCLCHGPVPSALTSARGPFKTATFRIAAGTVHYPTDAEPPFAAVAICGGFLNTGPEMASWAPFYASYGIVTVITSTGAADIPAIRASKLLETIKQLKAENTKSGSMLNGKLSGRYGTSGYSMGGGGTVMASVQDGSLKTSVGLAPWDGDGARVKVPTLLFCGNVDTVAPCLMAEGVYAGISDPTPKMVRSNRYRRTDVW